MARKTSALLLAAPILLGAAASTPETPPPRARNVLRLVHDGRFDEAQEMLAPAEDASSAFLSAFVDYWRLLYDGEDRALAARFEQKLLRAAEQGSRAGEAACPPWAAYARLLLAQLRATQKKPLLAAREARTARKLLDEALHADPSSPEPLFGLGTYNYYADRMSALVKGLRLLLGLPGGSREKGLEQLEASARRSSYFAFESRILLATIYGSRHELMYAEALRQAQQALDSDPEAVTLLDAAGRLYLSLGAPERAAEKLERALGRARQAPRTDPTVTQTLEYQSARVEFARFRPDRALAILRRITPARPLPARLARDATNLEAVAAALIGPSGSPAASLPPGVWAELVPALEKERQDGIPASLDALLALSRRMPEQPALLLLLGRAYLKSGRAEEALAALERADAQGVLPDAWIGPCRLLAGRAADLLGRRERALEYYRKAQKAPPFMESDAARFHQQAPFRKEL